MFMCGIQCNTCCCWSNHNKSIKLLLFSAAICYLWFKRVTLDKKKMYLKENEVALLCNYPRSSDYDNTQ